MDGEAALASHDFGDMNEKELQEELARLQDWSNVQPMIFSPIPATPCQKHELSLVKPITCMSLYRSMEHA